jgi:membrane-bound lytic murein transglycosylase D
MVFALLLTAGYPLCAQPTAGVPVDQSPGAASYRPASYTAAPSYLSIPAPHRADPALVSLPNARATADPSYERNKQSELHFRNGEIYLQLGRQQGARAEFDKAIEALLEFDPVAGRDPQTHDNLEELIQRIHRLEMAMMGIRDDTNEPIYDVSPLESVPELTFPVEEELRDQVRNRVQAGVSELPLEINDVVLSYVRHFTSRRGRRTFLAGYKKAGKYRDMIYRVLDEEGLPRELIHLAAAESGFKPRAVSRARAKGMWQFMLARGREYGLNRTKYIEERFDPEKSTRAVCPVS